MSMSLPTPPRTTHKDKENHPPSPPSNTKSRVPRIVWSQENLHHTYTNQIRQLPSSSLGPLKSILKKPSLPLMSLMPPEPPAREITPEPADPLHHPLYLNSPVSTLVASLRPEMDAKITLTDLTEAYSVLSARLKTKTHAMLDMCGPIPALEPMREHSMELVKAFHRDLGRAFVDPQSSPPPSRDSPWLSPSSIGSAIKRGFTDEEVKHARDLCNLTHAAIRCFSNISVVPVLTSVFTDEQLSEILTDILAIPLASTLPTPNSRKTCQLAVWTLQVQRLPTVVLAPAADRIAYALRRGIDGELGREGKKGATLDGLKAVAALTSYQPDVFLPTFADILSSVLACLTSQILTLRVQAAHAILSLARALGHHPTPPAPLIASLSRTTTSYIDEQRKEHKPPQDPSSLGKVLSACIHEKTPTHPALSPMWALSVIAALIVLSGADTFSHPRALKFVLSHLQTAMAVKKTTVRATTGIVWRSLIWSCVHLDDSDETDDKKNGGWRIVRQIVDGTIGISLVAALVGQKETKRIRISQALEVVGAMIKKGGKTCEEAVDTLDRLLCGVGSNVAEQSQESWKNSRLLTEPLFDCTLLDAEWKNLATHVKDALTKGVVVRDVRPLREEEVIDHWNVLFAIWQTAVERAPLSENGEAPAPLLNAWQALLLTQAQLTQGYEHLTSEPAFISQLTDLLKSYLTDQSLEWSLDAVAPSWSSQLLKLGFVRNLWSVSRNVFAMPTLSKAAESLLGEVLKHEYNFGQSEVCNTWAMLCAELVLAGMPHLVKELWKVREGGQDMTSSVKWSLWRAVGRQWIDQAGSWVGAIELLQAPFAFAFEWEFDRDDLDQWINLVDCALLTASDRRITPNTVLDAIAGEIGNGDNPQALYNVLPFLISAVDVSPSEHSSASWLPSRLLTLANRVLVSSYPPLDPGVRLMLFDVMESLTAMVKITSEEHIMELLIHIQDGIRIWVKDEMNAFSDAEFNERIITIYIASLEALKTVSLNCDNLHALTPLFISGFSRIPEPALGPSAFKSFWTQTYTLLASSGIDYPEDLKPVLRNVQQVMCTSGELVAPGLSPETQTPTLSSADVVLSVVPDSLGAQEQQHPIDNPPEPSHSGVLKVSELKVSDPASSPQIFCVSSIPEYDVVPDSLVCQSSPLLLLPHAGGAVKQEATTNDVSMDVSASPFARLISAEETSQLLTSTGSPPDTLHGDYGQGLGQRLGVAGPLEHPTPYNSPSIKEESQELSLDMGMNARCSQNSGTSSLGKRSKSRLATQSTKRRKGCPPPGIEIINISDEERDNPVALDHSIIATRIRRRKLKTEHVTKLQPTGVVSTPKSLHQPTTPKSASKRRTFFEAVELQKLGAEKLQRHGMLGRMSDGSPCERKSALNKARSESSISKRTDMSDSAIMTPNPSKRRRVGELSMKIVDWSDESPHQGMLSIGSDDLSELETPQKPSDASTSSPKSGQISASHIISPLPRRSRSETYQIPCDNLMSSSPLKDIAARHRLRRARTAPVTVAGQQVLGKSARLRMARSPSDEFLALEHAHVVVTSGASRMELPELLEASQLANRISTTLNEQMAKKLSSDEAPL